MVLASARLSAKSVARYRRLGSLARGIFSATSLIAAQTPADAERFVAIGAPRDRTCVAGNIKFDLDIGPGVMEAGRALRSFFGSSRPVWIAGSTHAGEEALVLAAHAELPPDVLLLLVPRHPERFDAVAQLLAQGGWKFARRSGGAAPDAEVRVVLVDSVGVLAALYAAADAAFVGGSLVPIGGHNLLEPAALGVPVLTGPFTANGREIAQLLLTPGRRLAGGGCARAGGRAAPAACPTLRSGSAWGTAGGKSWKSNRGSVARLLGLIEPLVDPAAQAARAAARPSAAH